MVQNNRIGDSEILVNKFINSVQLLEQGGQHELALEYDGTFYRQRDGIMGETPKPSVSLVEQQPMSGSLQIVVGRHSVTSLLAALLNEKEKVKTFTEPLTMKVSQLDDFIDGYSNVFHEDSVVEITTLVEKVDIVSFEPTFNNVAFKADIVLLFSNPINP